MAKTALAEPANDNKSNAVTTWTTGTFQNARTFLGDVRNEMRKVITPSRKEVQATTTVVLVVVLVFAAYFFVTDYVFSHGVSMLVTKLTGGQ
jgi:preprotein translocase subunit SecE